MDNRLRPYIGEIMYNEIGVAYGKIVRIESTTVWYVPVSTEVRTTHQGNFYDKDGNRKYAR